PHARAVALDGRRPALRQTGRPGRVPARGHRGVRARADSREHCSHPHQSCGVKGVVMRDSNRISLDDLGLMPLGDIAALPGEQLALLQEETGERLRSVEAINEWLNGAIALKYTDRAAMARLEAAKDTGTVRLADEDGVV